MQNEMTVGADVVVVDGNSSRQAGWVVRVYPTGRVEIIGTGNARGHRWTVQPRAFSNGIIYL